MSASRYIEISTRGILSYGRNKNQRLAGEGMAREAIAAELKIGVASVYRVLRAA